MGGGAEVYASTKTFTQKLTKHNTGNDTNVPMAYV